MNNLHTNWGRKANLYTFYEVLLEQPYYHPVTYYWGHRLQILKHHPRFVVFWTSGLYKISFMADMYYLEWEPQEVERYYPHSMVLL